MLQSIWWSNAIFFVSVHVAAIFGAMYWPPQAVPRATLILCFVVWQLGTYGITIGYHRLYSHRAFRARLGVRIILAAMGSSAFQGSIKVPSPPSSSYDPVHDPYAATRGLFYSHIGWIFFNPNYERMENVDRDDLTADPVVRYQHAYYVPTALFCGFVLPAAAGGMWGDLMGSFVWGGLVSKLAIWHCTFLVNSLAHWNGLQPYSDENTSRGNLLLALLTGGEGNHNFVRRFKSPAMPQLTGRDTQHHSFPHDFRSGPSAFDWDPSKWIILTLHRIGLVTGLRRAKKRDLVEAINYMRLKPHGDSPVDSSDIWTGEVWSLESLYKHLQAFPEKCIIEIDGFAVDATPYLADHPGGTRLLRKYATNKTGKSLDASWAYGGGLNNHSRGANRQMRAMRIAKLVATINIPND